MKCYWPPISQLSSARMSLKPAVFDEWPLFPVTVIKTELDLATAIRLVADESDKKKRKIAQAMGSSASRFRYLNRTPCDLDSPMTGDETYTASQPCPDGPCNQFQFFKVSLFIINNTMLQWPKCLIKYVVCIFSI